MNNIPTAEEFATEDGGFRLPRGVSYTTDIGELMIEFAKMHVEACIKGIIDNAEVEEYYPNPYRSESYYKVDMKSILDAYSISNIK
jgi:hypothetical protein